MKLKAGSTIGCVTEDAASETKAHAGVLELCVIGGWKYQGASGGIVYKITAAFRSDLSLSLNPVVISLSKESLDVAVYT